MTDLHNKNFALFFTRGLSLEKWDKLGIIHREIKLYQNIAGSFQAVYLFTYGGKKDLSYASLFPINVTIVPKPKFLPVVLYSILLPFLHSKKLRNVHILKTNQMDGSWTAVIAKKLYGAKLIIRCGYEWLFTIRQLKKTFFKKRFAFLVERYAYKNADRIVLTSDTSAKFVNENFYISLDEINVIPNYVDTEVFIPMDTEEEKGRVIFVGRLELEKNIESLIKAMQGISGHLVIIGQGSLKSKLEVLAKEVEVSVEFKGVISQTSLASELNKSEIFVLPSLYEGNPKVLLEAMSCGLACIGADVFGIRDVITDGEVGILCDTDSHSIHKAILRLASNPQLRGTLGVSARQEIVNKYSFEEVLKKELSVYATLH